MARKKDKVADLVETPVVEIGPEETVKVSPEMNLNGSERSKKRENWSNLTDDMVLEAYRSAVREGGTIDRAITILAESVGETRKIPEQTYRNRIARVEEGFQNHFEDQYELDETGEPVFDDDGNPTVIGSHKPYAAFSFEGQFGVLQRRKNNGVNVKSLSALFTTPSDMIPVDA